MELHKNLLFKSRAIHVETNGMKVGYIQKKLLQELMERSPVSAIGGVLLFLLLVVTCHFEVLSVPVAGSGTLVILSSVYRLWLIHRANEPTYFDGKFSRDLKASILASAAAWSLLSSWVFSNHHFDHFESHVTLLVVSGIAASGLVSFSADLKTFRTFLFLIVFVPVLFFGMPGSGEHALPFAVLSSLYVLFLYQQAKGYHRSLVKRFEYEKSLADERSLLSTILDAIPGYLTCFDADLHYVSMNSSLKEALGFTDDDYLGKNAGFFINEGPWIERLRAFAASDLELDVFEFQFQLPRQKESRWHLGSFRRARDENWIVSVAIDIHKEKLLLMEAEDQRIRGEQAEKMAVLGEMSSGIAHEINNPLAIIRGKTQLIERDLSTGFGSPETLSRNVTVIRETVDRITKIIRGLQNFARDGRQDPFVLEPVSTIIEDTLNLCHTRFKNNGIAIHIDSYPSGLEVECRSIQISQVLLNLMNNAFDAVYNLPEKWVRISVTSSESRIRIRVTDSGAGIPIELHEKIVRPFFTTKPVGKGTGLGLSISYGIVRSHGGSLVVDSNSKNTSFLMELPKQHDLSA